MREGSPTLAGRRDQGLSEVGPELVHRAHATYPLTAVQSEYLLWTRDDVELGREVVGARYRASALTARY